MLAVSQPIALPHWVVLWMFAANLFMREQIAKTEMSDSFNIRIDLIELERK
jgi:hypothetical protein